MIITSVCLPQFEFPNISYQLGFLLENDVGSPIEYMVLFEMRQMLLIWRLCVT